MAAVMEVAGQGRQKLVQRMAARFGVDPELFVRSLKATAFRVPSRWDPDERRKVEVEVTNEQMMSLLVVAEQYGLNPWTKEIYAFPDKGNGVVPIVGVDGWSRIINTHDDLDGIEFHWADEDMQIDDHHRPCPAWCEAVIYRKDRSKPTVVREYLDECYRPPFSGNKGPVMGPWQSHTKRFLRHKALIQCARIAFGFTGIYDEDEGGRIIEGQFTREEAPEARPSLTDQVRRKSQPNASESAEEPASKEAHQPNDDGSAGDGEDDKTATDQRGAGGPPDLAAVLRMVDAANDADDLDTAESFVGDLKSKVERRTALASIDEARKALGGGE